MTDKTEVYKDASGEWRWRRKARNNRIIADSGEGYGSRSGATKAAARVFQIKTPLWLYLLFFALGVILGLLLGFWWGDAQAAEDSVPIQKTTETSVPNAVTTTSVPNVVTTTSNVPTSVVDPLGTFGTMLEGEGMTGAAEATDGQGLVDTL